VAIHDIGLVVGAVVEQDDQRARIDAMFHGHVGMACPQFMSTTHTPTRTPESR
jgi:hypothetical protein